MQSLPHAGLVPVPQPTPALHARAEPELLRKVFSLDAGVQDAQNPAQRLPARQGIRPGYLNRLGRCGSSGSRWSDNSSGTIRGDAPMPG